MASEVFITRRGKALFNSNANIYSVTSVYYKISIQMPGWGSDYLLNNSFYGYGSQDFLNSSFIAPNCINNIISVAIVGGGGGATYMQNDSSGTYGFAGGGSGWLNKNTISITPGQKIECTIGNGGNTGSLSNISYGWLSGNINWTISHTHISTGGTTSFGTYLSANGGTKGKVCIDRTNVDSHINDTDWSSYTSKMGATIGAFGGNGGAGGGAIFWNMNNAIGGRGYQFGGGGGGKGGDGGTWGGGGAGLYNGGNGGVYGGGGGGGTTGGRGGCSNPANGALATTRYGGNAGQNGYNINKINSIVPYIESSGSILYRNFATISGSGDSGVCGNPGNIHWGGGGYGSNTRITNNNISQAYSEGKILCGGGGYGGRVNTYTTISGGGGHMLNPPDEDRSGYIEDQTSTTKFLVAGGGASADSLIGISSPIYTFSNNGINFYGITNHASIHGHKYIAPETFAYETIFTNDRTGILALGSNTSPDAGQANGILSVTNCGVYFNKIIGAFGGSGYSIGGIRAGWGGYVLQYNINKSLSYISNIWSSKINYLYGIGSAGGGAIAIQYYKIDG